MTLITWNDGGPLFKDGKVASEEGCCCGGKCGRCIVDGEWDCRYTTREQCEQCDTTVICQNLETAEERIVSDCSECDAETEWCYSMTEGPCGSWDTNGECEPCPCEEHGDCPDDKSCCDGQCVEPICNENRYFKVCRRIYAASTPAGVTGVLCTCSQNIAGRELGCVAQVVSVLQPYGIGNCVCGMTIFATIGPGCVLSDVIVARDEGGCCDDDPPEFLSVTEIAAQDCQSTFVPD